MKNIIIVTLFSFLFVTATTAYAQQYPSNGQPCPASGVWPAGCIPNGSPAPQPNPGGSGQPCPASGAWPAGCVPSGQSPTPPQGQPCPASGSWPTSCISRNQPAPYPSNLYTYDDASRMVGEIWRLPFVGDTFDCPDASSTYPTIPHWEICEYYDHDENNLPKYVELYAGVAITEQGAIDAHNLQIQRARSNGMVVEEYGSWAIYCLDSVAENGLTLYYCLKTRHDKNMNRKVFSGSWQSKNDARRLALQTNF